MTNTYDATSGYLDEVEQAMRERAFLVKQITLASRDHQFVLSPEAAAQIMVAVELRELTRVVETLVAVTSTK